MSFALFVSALQTELADTLPLAKRLELAPSEAWNVLVVAQLREVLKEMARARGRDPSLLETGRLFASVPGFEADSRAAARHGFLAEIAPKMASPPTAWQELPLEAFGQLYESLLSARPADSEHSLRKRTGSYYTPEALTRTVVDRALDALESTLGQAGLASRRLRIVDPALGAGAFLVQAARELARRSGRPLAEVVRRELFGADVSPLALAVAEASLWLLCDAPGSGSKLPARSCAKATRCAHRAPPRRSGDEASISRSLQATPLVSSS